MSDLVKETGEVRTHLYCHQCTGNFLALLDYDVDGQHVVECPHCGHEHCRKIVKGLVTGDRWDGRNETRINVSKRNVWKHDVLQMKTTTASHFIREMWLQRVSK